MNSLIAEYLKWKQTILVSITNLLAYKSNFVLQIIGPVVIFFLIKYNIWVSIYGFRGGGEIGGYTLRAMITYQGWVLVVSLLAKGYNSRNLAEDIRLGRISSYLIYPFDFWQYHFAAFLGFQILQFGIALVSIIVLASFGIFQGFTTNHLLLGLSVSLLAGMLWYMAQYALGLLAFWLEETWTLRIILIIIANFCSGAIIPLELFPDWARQLALYSPFPYLTYVPVKMFMGHEIALPLPPLVALTVWMFIAWLAGRFIWKRGVHMYSAAGM